MQCVCSVYAACEQCVGSVCALCVPPIETANDLPDDIDKWLTCFPQAKPCFLGGDTYMALLIGLSVPFPKLINLLSTWMRNKWYDLWKVYLQLEQPMSLTWLLFSTSMMDAELLKAAISDHIENIPVGLCLKTISIGPQGLILPNQQVKALHVYVDELDVSMANPLPMALYASKMSADHKFPSTFGWGWFWSWMQSWTPKGGRM